MKYKYKDLEWRGSGGLLDPDLRVYVSNNGGESYVHFSLSTCTFMLYVEDGRTRNTLSRMIRPEAVRRLAENLLAAADKADAANKSKARP